MDIHHRVMMVEIGSLMQTQESNEKQNPRRIGKLNDGDSMEMSCRKHNNANKSIKVQGDGDLM
jgi:hypothetical protein